MILSTTVLVLLSPSTDTVSFRTFNRATPILDLDMRDFSLFFFDDGSSESEIPMHKKTIVRVWVKCVHK
jgi:hypothetical protein